MTATTQTSRDALAESAIHEQWVSTYRTPQAQAFYEMAFDDVVRRLNPPPNSTILDAGCGSCAKSILLAARGLNVVAADFSEVALKLAEETVAAQGVADRITLKHGNLYHLPFKDGEFKFILCWGVLMHVPDLGRAMSELSRVLAPGGVLVVSEGNVYSAQSYLMRGLKKLLGKGRARVVKVPAGIETQEDTPEGVLVTRQTDMKWFVAEWERQGLRLRSRFAGQLTELYALMPWSAGRRLIHVVNRLWFRHVKLAGPAFANILMLEKPST